MSRKPTKGLPPEVRGRAHTRSQARLMSVMPPRRSTPSASAAAGLHQGQSADQPHSALEESGQDDEAFLAGTCRLAS